MPKNHTAKQIQKIKNYSFFNKLCELNFIKEIWLFGSRANENNRERSDIDLAILLTDFNSKNRLIIDDIVDEADTLLKIDITYLNRDLNEIFLEQINDSKKVLYKMEKKNIKDILKDLNSARNRLNQITKEEKTDIVRDATIQRFEFTFELFWKTCKKIFWYEGDPSTSPKETLRKAYQYKFIDNEKEFLNMLDDRNKTTHMYNEKTSEEIYKNILKYTELLDKSTTCLINEYDD